MPSAALIKTCLDVLHFSGLARTCRKRLRGQGTIFCLHHVLPLTVENSEFSPNSNLETTPEFLEEIIQLALKRGYELLSLSDAIKRIKNPDTQQKPFAVFTLDDGYKDNQIYAQPIFQKYNCPYTIFVAPGIVEGTTELWWRALEFIIAQNSKINLEIGNRIFSLTTTTGSEKNAAWNLIYPALRDAPEIEQRKITREFAVRYGLDLNALCKSVAMNWEELRVLSQDPLCTIAAHTMQHFLVAKLSAEDARAQIQNSKSTIAEKLGMPVEFFAYPYGDEAAAGTRDFAIAGDVGFAASVTTRKGVVYAGHADHLQALPRTMISSRYNKIRYIDTLLSGAPTFLLNRFRKINVT